MLSLLEVETPRRLLPLLPRLSRLLFDLRVQVVRVEAKLKGSRRTERLWLVEFDGGPIRPARRSDIQGEVLEVLGQLAALDPPAGRPALGDFGPEPPSAA